MQARGYLKLLYCQMKANVSRRIKNKEIFIDNQRLKTNIFNY